MRPSFVSVGFSQAGLPAGPASLHTFDLKGQRAWHSCRRDPTQPLQRGLHSSQGVTSERLTMPVRAERIFPRCISVRVVPAVKSGTVGWWEDEEAEGGGAARVVRILLR